MRQSDNFVACWFERRSLDRDMPFGVTCISKSVLDPLYFEAADMVCCRSSLLNTEEIV